jgi:hypothetical protein
MLERYKPGDTVSILVARRGRFQRISATFGVAPAAIWTVEPDPAAPDSSKTLMTHWLSGRP